MSKALARLRRQRKYGSPANAERDHSLVDLNNSAPRRPWPTKAHAGQVVQLVECGFGDDPHEVAIGFCRDGLINSIDSTCARQERRLRKKLREERKVLKGDLDDATDRLNMECCGTFTTRLKQSLAGTANGGPPRNDYFLIARAVQGSIALASARRMSRPAAKLAERVESLQRRGILERLDSAKLRENILSARAKRASGIPVLVKLNHEGRRMREVVLHGQKISSFVPGIGWCLEVNNEMLGYLGREVVDDSGHCSVCEKTFSVPISHAKSRKHIKNFKIAMWRALQALPGGVMRHEQT